VTRSARPVIVAQRNSPLPTPPLGLVIARRRLYEIGKPRKCIELRIGRPVSVQDGRSRHWACPYQIKGLGTAAVQRVYGVDSLQTLELVLREIRRQLDESGRAWSFDASDTEGIGHLSYHIPWEWGVALEKRIKQFADREVATYLRKLRAKNSKRQRPTKHQ
jgi:hypothetical protein